MTKPRARRQRGTGSLFRWKGKGPWWMKFYRGGVAILQSCKTADRREAEAMLKECLKEDDDTPAKFRKATVKDLFDDLVVDYRINNLRSLGHLELRWRLHLAPVFSSMLARQVKSSHVANYIDGRKQEGAANASINRELAILRRTFSVAMEHEKIKTAPRIRMLEENNTRTGFLSSKDRDALAAACGRIGGLWMRALFETAVTLGWRYRELLGLRVRQVNLATNSIRLEPGTTKNGEGRECPMTPAIHQLLSGCIHGKAPGDYVFTRAGGEPVRDIRREWTRACAEAGVGNLLFHDLRRSAARNLRNAGVSETVVMAVGGWRTSSMFRRYAIVDQSDISDALVKLERQREAETLKQAVEQEAEPLMTRPI
jgi:integrase